VAAAVERSARSRVPTDASAQPPVDCVRIAAVSLLLVPASRSAISIESSLHSNLRSQSQRSCAASSAQRVTTGAPQRSCSNAAGRTAGDASESRAQQRTSSTTTGRPSSPDAELYAGVGVVTGCGGGSTSSATKPRICSRTSGSEFAVSRRLDGAFEPSTIWRTGRSQRPSL
jgi:hypothetical protein